MARRAKRHHGNVTHADLIGSGLTDTSISWRVRRGRLYRVHPGVYAVGRPPSTPVEHAAAAVLACGPGAALSHLGALALWGFTKRWPASFDVVVTTGDRRPHGITTHRYTGLLRRDLTVQLGIRATSPARTLLDCAPELDPQQRKRTVNDALHTAFLTQNQLSDVRHRFPTHPGAKLLDPFLDGQNPTRSSFEDDFIAFCERHNLPRPLVNVRVAGHTVDALFRPQRLIVELDGWEFHRDREAFETDRARDGATLKAGYRTRRITWDRLHDEPVAEAELLRELLRRQRPA
ncbi:MAG TPA: type IV toxin-antitoxin system AbiEi family antitoxin domain-containing protein [Solirubrobacteraceae bacterium]|nr:type IV toxin-antitoxin system AbiEi family antitoxin domain-containing protein [Solirubrobacteraceae bacterium]